MMRSANVFAAFFLFTSAVAAPAQETWVLWRQFIPSDNPEPSDAQKWLAEPGAKTKAGCEAEAKEYRSIDPNKRLRDPDGREYRVEYRCLPDTTDPAAVKGK